jgi:hypothetical protein
MAAGWRGPSYGGGQLYAGLPAILEALASVSVHGGHKSAWGGFESSSFKHHRPLAALNMMYIMGSREVGRREVER